MNSQNTGNRPTASTEKNSGMNSYPSGVPGDNEEPLMVHLLELRNRLAIVLIWLCLGILIAFPFSAKGMLIVWKEFINTDFYMTAYSPLEWTFARLINRYASSSASFLLWPLQSLCSSTSFTGLQAKDFIHMRSAFSSRSFLYPSCFSSLGPL